MKTIIAIIRIEFRKCGRKVLTCHLRLIDGLTFIYIYRCF